MRNFQILFTHSLKLSIAVFCLMLSFGLVQLWNSIVGVQFDFEPSVILADENDFNALNVAAWKVGFVCFHYGAMVILASFNLSLAIRNTGQINCLPRARAIADGSFLMALLLFCLGFLPLALLGQNQMHGIVLCAVYSAQIASGVHVLMTHLAFSAHMRQMARDCHQALAKAARAEGKARQEQSFRHRQSRFLGMLGHELKTPLAVIDSAAQSLQQLPGSELPEVARRHLRIRKAVKHIDALLGQCLTQDRIDDAGLAVRFHAIDLARLAHGLIEERPDEDKARITLKAPPALPMRGDAALLRIALLNLLDNALKYSPPATPVSLSMREENRENQAGLAIDVADCGPGISSTLGETIFEPFVRGEQSGDTAGTGLGLYLARRIVEMHQGCLSFESRMGACFRVWLPFKEETMP
jgi:signal transduction histidine kinase